MPRRRKSSYNRRYRQKPAWMRMLELIGPKTRNKIPVIKQIRSFKARRAAIRRLIKGNLARLATLGYVKPLSHPRLKPCKGVRKQMRRAYFGFKNARNWRRGGNRARDYRPKGSGKTRFTVLNCK